MKKIENAEKQTAAASRYAVYVLLVLVLVYICNFVDRLIISILAEDIKQDLGISDRQLGFIAGTAFAVFYALFGLPLGRLADIWVRTRLIAIGLIAWSCMTVLSGTAKNFIQLALYRCGVGVGEASASPAAFSLLADYFPKRVRATVLAVYTSGGYIGMGLGVFLGGYIVDGWNGAYPDASSAPLGLAAWQAALIIVGAPGILLGIWVATLREPLRGQSEGIITAPHPRPLRTFLTELAAILPVLSIINFIRTESAGKALSINLAILAVTTVLMTGCTIVTNDVQQWFVYGVGIYATASWIQNLSMCDPPTFALMFRCRSFLLTIIGFCSINFFTYGLAVWTPSFFIRVHDMSPGEVGMIVGLSIAISGGLSINIGGYIADLWRRRSPRGRVYFGLITVILTIPAALVLFLSPSKTVALVANFCVAGLTAMWVGPATSTIMDLVLPRMRAVAAAFYFLVNVFLGLAFGPYLIGYFSDKFIQQGSDPGESLKLSLMFALATYVVPLVCLLLVSRSLEDDEGSRLQRARSAGEIDV